MPEPQRFPLGLTRRMVKAILVGRGRVLGKSDDLSNYRGRKKHLELVSVVPSKKYATPGN